MKTILVPVDFQSASIRSLRYLEDVFREKTVEPYPEPPKEPSAEVLLLNVIAPNDPTEPKEVEKAFKTFESKVLQNFTLPYKFEVRRGELLEEIQKTIHQYKPSLVIIGTSGKNLSKAFLKLTDCPVLTIPEGNSRTKIKSIAYANDFHDIKASSAFAPLADLSQTFDAKVHIVHLNKDERTTPDDSEAALEYYLQLVDHDYASIPSDNYVTALQEYVHNEDIDILTVLLRDHGKNTIPSKGRLIEELVNQTDVPILSLV